MARRLWQAHPANQNNRIELIMRIKGWSNIPNRSFYGDKIYLDTELLKNTACVSNSEILTPVKGVKGQSNTMNQWGKTANDLYSRAVSRVRQPIESLFNWIIEKTDIQRASKVRSAKGLLIHVFGRIAAAFIFLIFNS